MMTRLGASGIEVSSIGLGCWQFSQGKGMVGRMWATLDQDTVDAIVGAALKAGVTWFDTAQVYGNGQSERALSAALHANGVAPGDVVVATKWFPIMKTAGSIGRTIHTRLTCLQGYPIDLHQVHQPWSLSSVAAQMKAMAALVRAGNIRAVGVSNFSARQMVKAAEALRSSGLPLASNQVPVSLLDRRIERNGLLETARSRQMTLIAYSPLAQGVLTGRFHDDPASVRSLRLGRRLSWISPMGRFLTAQGLARTTPLIEELRSIGEAHHATAAQVALAWVTAFYGETVVAIPGASRVDQARENAAAMDLHLGGDELARLDRLSAVVARFG